MVPSATSTGLNNPGSVTGYRHFFGSRAHPRNWSERWHAYSRDLLAGLRRVEAGAYRRLGIRGKRGSNIGKASVMMGSQHRRCGRCIAQILSFCKTTDRCMISRERKSSVAACSVLPVEPRPNKEDTFNVEAEEL